MCSVSTNGERTSPAQQGFQLVGCHFSFKSDEFPLAKPQNFDSFYVDDCLAGADNAEQAFLLQQRLQGLLEKGGFLLRKWRSNSTDVLDSIPQELKESTAVQPIVQEDAHHKMLGIH